MSNEQRQAPDAASEPQRAVWMDGKTYALLEQAAEQLGCTVEEALKEAIQDYALSA